MRCWLRGPELLALSLGVACSLLVLPGCSAKGGAEPVGERLEARVAEGASSFDFAAESQFQWDRMYVFGPYTPRDRVEQILGFKWSGYGRTTIESNDSVELVVFVSGRKVVKWYEQPVDVGLSALEGDRGFDRGHATFRIVNGELE